MKSFKLPQQGDAAEPGTQYRIKMESFQPITKTIGSENIIADSKVTIHKLLQLLSPRDDHVLIQFWSPCIFGKHMLLKTTDQPFRLDIANDIFDNYRRQSECIMFAIDDTCKDEDLNPVVRVFMHGMPEWTCDITDYLSKDYEKDKNYAFVHWNLHGYLVLPVFYSSTMKCVGVLEFVTTSKYLDFAYEVQQVHRILKETNLKSPQAFVGRPTSYVSIHDKITQMLKDICDTHNLPLAQTWMVSSLTSFVVTGRNITKTCSSYSSSCTGITCMSTNDLPFYVHDDRYAHFREACSVHHLQISQGVVGRAFSSHGSCFCEDVKKLDEKEYYLVHKARTTELASCFAIYLHSNEHDAEYVLEFFLPVDMREGADQQNMVQNLNQHLKFFSGFESGDLLSTTCVGMSMEFDTLSLAMQPYIIQTSLSRELMQIDSPTSGKTKSPIEYINSQDEFDLVDINNNPGSAIPDQTTSVEKGYGSGEKQISTRPRRKRKLHLFTLETVRLYFGMPIGEASRRLGVSRSTLKHECRDLGILTWPKPQRNKKYNHFGVYTAVLLLVKLKRWSCSSNRHGFSARWWICDKHNSSVSKLKLSIQENSYPVITSPLAISPEDDPRFPPPYLSQPLKEPGDLDTRYVTVKATFNHDTVKFDFPISFGLMRLKIQVAQRLNLQSTRVHLKYTDEDDDLILIACDADLHNLMPFSATSGSNGTLKLIVEMAHEDKSIK